MDRLAIHGGLKAAEGLNAPAWPSFDEEDRRALWEALESRQWCLGPKVTEFERAFAAYHHAKHGVSVANGTVALELALRACGVQPGDEVLVPAVTFIASASAPACVGAVPIFVDSDPETISIDPKDVEARITSRTRAVIGVHYGGYPIDLDALLSIARRHNLALIEDCAHAQGTEWKGRRVGAIGAIGGMSFQASKALAAGEGGIVLTDRDDIAERAVLLHHIGRMPGQPGYEHHLIATNCRMSEFHAAFLLSSMRKLPEAVQLRHETGVFLAAELRKVGGIDPLRPDARITKRGYYFFILKYDREQFQGAPKEKFLNALSAEGAPCGSGYAMPLYRQPGFRRDRIKQLLPDRLGPIPDYENLHLPVAEKFCSEQQITIPHHVLLTGRSGAQKIIDAVVKIKRRAGDL